MSFKQCGELPAQVPTSAFGTGPVSITNCPFGELWEVFHSEEPGELKGPPLGAMSLGLQGDRL